jgi:Ca2+-binding RTX toxin-like protein
MTDLPFDGKESGSLMRLLAIVASGLLIATVTGLAAPAGHAGAADPPSCFDRPATKWLTSPGVLIGTSGDDVLVGSSGNDTIKGNGGNDTICGGDGDDKINGNSGNDLLIGEDGSDIIAGDAGDDDISGDLSFTDCDASSYDDVLTGGSGNDQIVDLCGSNKADGGAGRDFVFVSGTARGGADGDRLVRAFNGLFDDCESCVVAYADGGSGNDEEILVYGGSADGGSGNDHVFAEKPGDEIRGGSGHDTLSSVRSGGSAILNGGSGTDTCDETNGTDTLISCEKVV